MKTSSRLIVSAVVVGLGTWMFADVLFADRLFGFRDAAHFYYPLFQFIQDQWAAGHVPVWNPYENGGVPLAGDLAASVFYPGKLIFALPIGFAWAYKVYIIGHMLLAVFWAYRLARAWRASVEAAGLCAISYAFSGNILYQYINVIYLVGAAWFPAALLAADHMLRRRSPRWAILFGVTLALMTLGGDPQAAYHAGLLAGLYGLILWRWRRRTRRAWKQARGSGERKGAIEEEKDAARDELQTALTPALSRRERGRLWLRSTPVLLAMAGAVAFVLAAVQVLPSMVMTRASNRAATETARSVWEIPAALGRDNPTNRIADGLLCRDVPFGTHHRTVYYFSVGPWRLVEYLWPNCFGRQFPEHRRWIHVLPGEGRVWTPSLYMGVLPLLLAIGSLRFRQGPVRRRWMSWTVLLAVLAALGWHGLGWLVLQGQVALGADPLQPGAIGEPVGGLYWFMTVLLPGYIYFRYPAKLLGVAALALSVLAGWGLDRATAGQARGLRRALLALGVLSLLGVAVAAVLGLWWDDWFRDAAPEVMFGSLDAEGAFNDLLLGFVQTSTVCLLAWWLLRRKNGPKDDSRTAPVGLLRRALPVSTCLLVLVAIDLAVANGWMIASAPAKLWRTPSQAAVAIRADAARRGNHDTIQVWRYPSWTPIFWSWSHSPNRLSHSVRWERATLWPKYNLTERIGVVNVYGTMMSDEHYRLLMHNDPVTVMRATGAKYAILPQGLHLPGGEKLPVELLSASIWYLPDEPAGASATSGQRLGVVETRDLYSERRHLDILLATGAVGSGLGWLVLIGSCVWKRRRHWVRTTARS